MMKVSGMYVSPAEVEAALVAHEDVLEAAVVGAPDADGLVKPKAFVVVKTGRARRRAVRPGARRARKGVCWRRSNARAGSLFWTSCQRLPPARSSALSCARR